MENDDRWTHHRLISPQRPRGQTPTRDDLMRDYVHPHQESSPTHHHPGGYDQTAYGMSPVYAMGHPQSPVKRKRRKGLRAGMVIASLAIVAASRVLLPEVDSVQKVLQALIGNKTNNTNQIITILLREHISSAKDLLRCSDDDLRMTGLRVGDIALIRENRPSIEAFISSPSAVQGDGVKQLQDLVATREAEIASLRQQLAEKDSEIESLKQSTLSKPVGAAEMLSEVAAEAESNLVSTSVMGASRSSRPAISQQQTAPSYHSAHSQVPTHTSHVSQPQAVPTSVPQPHQSSVRSQGTNHYEMQHSQPQTQYSHHSGMFFFLL